MLGVWWFVDALAADASNGRQQLENDVEVDLAIVGGGYTGLWTALALAERDAGLKVALMEAGRGGLRPAARTGGVVHGYWTGIARVMSGFGHEDSAGDRQCGIAFRAGGALLVLQATRGRGVVDGERHRQRLDHAGAGCGSAARRRRGARTRSPRSGGSALTRRTAPASTAAGLPEGRSISKREPQCIPLAWRGFSAERQSRAAGASVYEDAAVIALTRESERYRLITPRGSVRARAVVLATNAALTGLPQPRAYVTNFSSYAIMTEPAPEALAEHGWTGGEALLDSRMFLHYFRTTPDGRVLMGTGSGPIGYGARLSRHSHATARQSTAR